ncbi:MAG: hypothetical protein J5I90_06425 [Caldilineales bacterium]|nr:hypothetical protein [Caldilineales bacterium]
MKILILDATAESVSKAVEEYARNLYQRPLADDIVYLGFSAGWDYGRPRITIKARLSWLEEQNGKIVRLIERREQALLEIHVYESSRPCRLSVANLSTLDLAQGLVAHLVNLFGMNDQAETPPAVEEVSDQGEPQKDLLRSRKRLEQRDDWSKKVEKVKEYLAYLESGNSQQAAAELVGEPRQTLNKWRERHQELNP